MSSGPSSAPDGARDPFGCPFCGMHTVERLFLASTGTDNCSCLACGRDWDENRGTGELVDPGVDGSGLAPPAASGTNGRSGSPSTTIAD